MIDAHKKDLTTFTFIMLFRICSLLILALGSSAQEINIGSFRERQHNVSGDVVALSERVLEIRNFEYDGQGPAVYFWIDTSSVPSSGGKGLVSPWNAPACGKRLGRSADGTETVRVELPEGSSLLGKLFSKRHKCGICTSR